MEDSYLFPSQVLDYTKDFRSVGDFILSPTLVRGLNSPAIHFEVREVIRKNSIDLFSLLETKIMPPNAQGIIDAFGSDRDPHNNVLENSPDPISIWIF